MSSDFQNAKDNDDLVVGFIDDALIEEMLSAVKVIKLEQVTVTFANWGDFIMERVLKKRTRQLV